LKGGIINSYSCVEGEMSMGQRGFTLIELLVVISIIAVLFILILPELGRPRERPNIRTNNLKMLGLVCKMYENENGGVWPSLKLRSSENGRCADWNQSDLVFDTEKVYPEYLSDMNVLACPNDSER
jgi:prepilin-type N-terminal cleavage/methylation domain-containing protein